MWHLLVVDDDRNFRIILRRMLERAGYQVEEAPDGEEATELARRHAFDLAIVDMLMPRKDGLETIKELRRIYPGLKVIAVSAGSQRRAASSLLIAAEVAGADRTLTKPFGTQEILNAVDTLLGREQPAPAVPG